MCKLLECIFVPRGSTPEALQKCVTIIEERQKAVEEKGIFSPQVVFAEGGTSNGTRIGPLKRGAFTSLRTVEPTVIKYEG